jgi:hypothetical protein
LRSLGIQPQTTNRQDFSDRQPGSSLMLKLSFALLGVALVVISGCAPAHVVADRGRQSILGMDANTLKSCAGIPTRTEQLQPGVVLYSYENRYERTGGAQITLPIIGGGFSLGGSGSYCHAVVRIVDGRVAAVNYAGDNDDMIGKEGICAPIFRGCLRAQERAAKGAP